MNRSFPLSLLLLSLSALMACGGGSVNTEHGTISELSAVSADNAHLCEHEVPGEVCVRCNPELVPEFQAVGDWCGPHDVPESQCHRCHPDLNFDPLPEVEEEADMSWITHEEALEGLGNHAVAGQVTVFDFSAAWCAACRNLEGHLRQMVNNDPSISVRQIEVGAWEGPVVETYMSHVSALPFVIVYGPDGEVVGEAAEATNDDVDALIRSALNAQ